MAVELSRSYRDDPRRWPFGAVLVGEGKILGQGYNQVEARNLLMDLGDHADSVSS
jgi:tRNA(Arg) A34 adenosine deaminase TadA